MAGASRPFPITVVPILAGLGALSGIVLGGLALAGGGGVYAVVVLVLGLLYFVCAYGLWSLQGWAWMLSMLAQILTIVASVAPLASGGSVAYVQLIVAVIILLYLNSGGVRKAFGR